MTNTEKSKVVRKIAKHRGQYYITLGMLEDAGACFTVRKAIAKRLKTPYPNSKWDDQHPNRDVPIRFTEELLRKVMGAGYYASVAKPWQVLDYVAYHADNLYGSRLCAEAYNTEPEVDYFGSSFYKESVDSVVDKFREWGYIE